MASQATDTNALYHENMMLTIILMAVALVLGSVAAVWISMTISRGLAKARGLANAVAIGDLDQSIEIKSNDEIKDLVTALNSMTENLRATAGVADAIAGGDLTVQSRRLS